MELPPSLSYFAKIAEIDAGLDAGDIRDGHTLETALNSGDITLDQIQEVAAPRLLAQAILITRGRILDIMKSSSHALSSAERLLEATHLLIEVDPKLAKNSSSICLMLFRKALGSLRERDDLARAHGGLARILVTRNADRAALMALRDAIRLTEEPDKKAHLLYERAKIMERIDRIKYAKEIASQYREGMAASPCYEPPFLALAHLLEQEGSVQEALNILQALEEKSRAAGKETSSGILNEIARFYNTLEDESQQDANEKARKLNLLLVDFDDHGEPLSSQAQHCLQTIREVGIHGEALATLMREQEENQNGETSPEQDVSFKNRVRELSNAKISSEEKASESISQLDVSVEPERFQRLLEAYEEWQCGRRRVAKCRYERMKYLKAAAHHPEPFPPAMVNYGTQLLEAGRIQLAVVEFSNALSKGMTVAKFFLGLCYSLPSQNNIPEAKRLLTEFLSETAADQSPHIKIKREQAQEFLKNL